MTNAADPLSRCPALLAFFNAFQSVGNVIDKSGSIHIRKQGPPCHYQTYESERLSALTDAFSPDSGSATLAAIADYPIQDDIAEITQDIADWIKNDVSVDQAMRDAHRYNTMNILPFLQNFMDNL